MAVIVALYSGNSVSTARLVACTVDPDLAADVARRLLGGPLPDDPILAATEHGRRAALRVIARDGGEVPDA